jgi:delta-aminolevulinic acid dehydratase/porphobilinogen synthase
VKAETGYRFAAYQVSGEYAQIQAAAEARLDRPGSGDDGSLIGIRRAGPTW